MKTHDQQIDCDPQFENVTVRPAISEDAHGIALVFIESAEHHSNLDPELYFIPAIKKIVERYRRGQQHPAGTAHESVTLVAEFGGEIVGFVDARLYQSTDAMHRDIVFCHVVEIAVSRRHQRRGIGVQLLEAAEEWGRQRGANVALLEYHSANTQASMFYQSRMGYRPTSVTVIRKL